MYYRLRTHLFMKKLGTFMQNNEDVGNHDTLILSVYVYIISCNNDVSTFS
jgi:hypothetical protein